MSQERSSLPTILERSRTKVVFGAGTLDQLGRLAAEAGGSRVLLVSDPGIVRAGHVERAAASLRAASLAVAVFDAVEENPTTEHVARGVEAARAFEADLLVGLGGGSSMDCAKGVNFILTNGGEIRDYWGTGKATKSMLPMLAVPTTAGTGSEAQSFALICDATTKQKMACGDPKAACVAAILDPDLTRTQPRAVAAATGIDAVAHAVETAGSTKRNEVSLAFTREAWSLLDRAFDRAIADAEDATARADMLLGAHLAGAAIEHSMLGAAHACANPVTARFGTTHGLAVGALLPHVVRFNVAHSRNPYEAIVGDPEVLIGRLEGMLSHAGLPRSLRAFGVDEAILPDLADEASKQWTAAFNPIPVGPSELATIYRSALA